MQHRLGKNVGSGFRTATPIRRRPIRRWGLPGEASLPGPSSPHMGPGMYGGAEVIGGIRRLNAHGTDIVRKNSKSMNKYRARFLRGTLAHRLRLVTVCPVVRSVHTTRCEGAGKRCVCTQPAVRQEQKKMRNYVPDISVPFTMSVGAATACVSTSSTASDIQPRRPHEPGEEEFTVARTEQ